MQPIRPGFTGVFTALVTPMRPQDGDENTALAPDRIGNPALRPELATGLDVAFEHDLGGGGYLQRHA